MRSTSAFTRRWLKSSGQPLCHDAIHYFVCVSSPTSLTRHAVVSDHKHPLLVKNPCISCQNHSSLFHNLFHHKDLPEFVL
jgi:hypothetical protein